MKKSTITILGIAIMIFAAMSSANKLHAGTGDNGDEPVSKVNPMLRLDHSGHALGIRGIGTTGITYKHYGTNGKAFEGIFGFGNNFFSITALGEKYSDPFDSDFVSLYYGFGGHATFQSNSNIGSERNRFNDADDAFGLGVDFIVGLEMVIPDTPIALSLDIKPFVEVATNGNAYVGIDPGLGVKILF